MRVPFIALLLCVAVNSSFINPYPRFAKYNDGGDPGDPAFLTPLIQAGKIDKALELATVADKPFDWLKSYAGYLTVNEKYNSNMFFWYFPSESDPHHDPIVLWLQGGPGASSLFGLFTENGPFSVTESGLEPRKYSWHKNHNLIYIDNPVGTGFSFTDDDAGYAKNEKDVGRDLYEAVKQLFQLFPEFQTLDFYITGESYAGKYVPALAYKIHKTQEKYTRHGKKIPVPIKLKGIAIGNGLSDPIHQLKYGDYLYQLGLIDINARQVFHEYETKGIDCIKKRDMNCAFEVFDELINMDELPSGSLFHNYTGYDTYFNYLKTKGDNSSDIMGKFLQTSKIRKAIHVGNMTFHDLEGENKVEEHLKQDVMDSVAPWIAELLGHYRVCIYNGQLDIIVAYPLTLGYLQRLKFPGANIYKHAPRYIWRIDGEIAGYAKEAGQLVEVLVRKAGHMAPADQPKWVFDMITRLTNGKGFS